MTRSSKPITILIAEDDPDDRLLLKDAFDENRLTNELRFVGNGEELLAYLRRTGDFADPRNSPAPGLILLDLNMPKMDGREALRILKSDPQLQRIPVVVLTTSKAEEDIIRTYGLGVSSFIAKPVSFDGLINVVQVLTSYWIQIVELPPAAVAA
ncbi:MAG: response regulator [Alphaproteobacteria bacterium]|nr:response regulator [Alphaproteobacteria bacterium]